MLTPYEHGKLLHDIKRMASVLKIIAAETDHDKRQTLITLLSDEADRLASDIGEMKEK
jgi:hypothetical protein